MNKTQSEKKSRHHEPLQAEAGVGQYYADPQKEEVKWEGVYYQGNFYLADPKTYSKLQEVEANLDLEKRLASVKMQETERAESVRQFNPQLQMSNLSYATEHNAQKSKIKQIQAQKQLQREEQINFKRMVDAKQKKGTEKKPIKNLIQVKRNKKEQNMSEKEFEGKPKEEFINQSMMMKLRPYRNTSTPTPPEKQLNQGPKAEQVPHKDQPGQIMVKRSSLLKSSSKEKEFSKKSSKSIKKSKVNELEAPKYANAELGPNSIVQINLEQYNKDAQVMINSRHPKSTHKAEEIHVKVSQPTQNNMIASTAGPLPHTFGVPEPIQSEKERSNDQSEIINNLMEPKVNEKEPSILDLQSEEEQIINGQAQIIKTGERAGNSFFNDINTQMYKLRANLDQANGEKPTPHPQAEDIEPKIENSSKYRQSERRNFKYQPTNTLEDTKNILKELDQHFKVADFNDQSDKSISIIQEQKLLEKESEPSAYIKVSSADFEKKNQQHEKQVIVKETPKKDKSEKVLKVEEQSNFKKKKDFQVTPTIVNYQISQVATANPTANIEEKQKLQKQIGVLQQVIGELRVERVKYQASQAERSSRNQESAFFSNVEPTERGKNGRRFSEIPEMFNKTHRPMGTSNFEESVVSEFQSANRSNLVKNKSGKIVKNYPGQKNMPQIQEQEKDRRNPVRQILEQVQFTSEHYHDISIQASLSRQNISENQEPSIQQSSMKNKGIPKKSEQKIESKPRIVSKNAEIQVKKQVKTKEGQHKFKISTSERKRSVVSQPKSRGQQPSTESIVIHEDTPLPNKSQRTESDLDSSMPRHLISKYNYSVPPKISIEEYSAHKKMKEQEIQKNLMSTFTKLQNSSVKKIQPQEQQVDPKRRAIRQGLLKNLDNKSYANPESGKVQNSSVHINKKMNNESNVKNAHESKSIKNFRMRKDSEGIRNSAVHRNKSCDTSKTKQQEKLMYMPGLEERSFNNDPSLASQGRRYEMKFQFDQKQKTMSSMEGFNIQERNISFTNVQIPEFPQPPSPNITVEQMAELIKRICNSLGIEFQDNQIHKLIMKKYKNCIMLDLPTHRKIKLVWHYNGKVFVGQWNQATMMKSGEGIELVPQKYFYKGQFMGNKKNGTGIMIFENGSRYEGQWLDGQKNGRGKYEDRQSKYYYEGEWKEGKKQGYGYLHIEDFSIFQGTFQNNHRYGFGTQKFVSGDSYKGEYQKGKFHGKGVYIWSSGASFEGNFVEGVKQGQGKWRSETGQLFVGSYLRDKKHGFGKYKWENGTIFEGEFREDRQHGRGFLKKMEGQNIEGIWEEGKLIDVVEMDQHEAPLEPKKSKAYEATTIVKVVESRPSKIAASGKLSHV